MKRYGSLAQARKSLARQLIILVLSVLLVFTAVRLMTGNRFDTALPIYYSSVDLDASDLVLKWEQDSIPVADYRTGIEADGPAAGTFLYLSLLPEEPGVYRLLVQDRKGYDLAEETFHVGRYLTTFAEVSGNFTGDKGFFLASVLFYCGLSVLMLRFFLKLRGSQIYSYSAIFSLGVFIFATVNLIVIMPVVFRRFRSPGMNQTWMFLDDIASGGQFFSVITFPLILIFSILLIISNIELLRHERPRVQNALGLILGFLMIGGDLFFIRGGLMLLMPHKFVRIAMVLDNIVGTAFAYVECILLSSVICGLRAAKHVPEYDRDYILILGCGFRKDGTLPPLLKGRVDKAIEFWHSQLEKTGKQATLIPSGGQGRSEPMAEAEAMYRYIISTGFPENCVIREDQSANTFQNMAFSKRIIDEQTGDSDKAKIAFATTNYHVFRSGIWSNLAGLRAEGIGSRTKWWFWPNAFIRECIALLKNRLVPELLFLMGLAVVAGLFTWLSFL